jgi:hypothetical protein
MRNLYSQDGEAVEAKVMKAAEVIVFVKKSNYTNSRKHVVS